MVNCRDCRRDSKCSKPFENEEYIQKQYLGRAFADEEDWFTNGNCDYFESAKNTEQLLQPDKDDLHE